MFLVNSREGLFVATSWAFGSKFLYSSRHTFFRSYGASLQSSLTRVLPRALEYSSHPPVSVYGTGNIISRLEAFLGTTVSLILNAIRRYCSACKISVTRQADFPTYQPTSFEPLFHQWPQLTLCVPPSLKQYNVGIGILTNLPSTTPFGLVLGPD